MKKAFKIAGISLLALLALLVLIVLGHVVYVAAEYDRIEDYLQLTVDEGATEAAAHTGVEYGIVTYNIGFGAYSPDFSFFLDSGEMNDGTVVTGKYGKGLSEDVVRRDVEGAAGVLKGLDADFYFVQEVDTDGDRSYHIDQYAILRDALPGDATYSQNFHCAKLLYPFNDPHGKNTSGIATFSTIELKSAVRRQYPVDDGFAKFFDLDRCFAVHRVAVEGGKELVLINSHMSAYDEGGTIRAQQLEMLNAVMAEEYEKGNYVIVGGDFNHELAHSFGNFPSEQKQPTWAYELTDDDVADGFRIVASGEGVGTCRAAEIPYTEGVNYQTVLDGFVVSDNVEVIKVRNIDTGCEFSDHNPVEMTFVLK